MYCPWKIVTLDDINDIDENGISKITKSASNNKTYKNKPSIFWKTNTHERVGQLPTSYVPLQVGFHIRWSWSWTGNWSNLAQTTPHKQFLPWFWQSWKISRKDQSNVYAYGGRSQVYIFTLTYLDYISIDFTALTRYKNWLLNVDTYARRVHIYIYSFIFGLYFVSSCMCQLSTYFKYGKVLDPLQESLVESSHTRNWTLLRVKSHTDLNPIIDMTRNSYY